MAEKDSQHYFLLIETSIEICSIAIADQQRILYTKETEISNTHSEVITILIQECLLKSHLKIRDLSAVAISNGPGSYTSLRVGAATAKGICYALQIPLIAINSLESLANGVPRDPSKLMHIIPMIDARRMEIYASVFNQNIEVVVPEQPIIIDDQAFVQQMHSDIPIHVCGSGAQKFYDQYASTQRLHLHHVRTSASFMHSIAIKKWHNREFVDIAYYTPNYIKPPNITISNKNYLA